MEFITFTRSPLQWTKISVQTNHSVGVDSYTSGLDLFVCPICSSVVKDQEQHSQWHIDNLSIKNYSYNNQAGKIQWYLNNSIN